MNWLSHLTIVNKLSVMLVSVLCLFSILTGLLLFETLSDIMTRDLIARGASISSEVAELARDAILSHDLLALEELLSMEKEHNDFIAYAFISDDQNKIMAHTFSQGIPKGLLALHGNEQTADVDVKRYMSDRGPIQDIQAPIEDGSLGYVRLGLDESAIEKILANNLLKLAAIIFATGLLGAIFVHHLTHVFTAPLNQLIDFAQKIAKGNADVKPMQTTSTDEFGQLTTAMNTMARHLRHAAQDRQRLLAHLMTAQEDERRRISMELHDETGQALTALLLSLRTLARQASNEESRQYILAVREEAAHTFQRLRSLAVELRPPALDELGLEAAISNLVESYRQHSSVAISFRCQLDRTPGETFSLAVYRMTQECLTNILKHAQAAKAEIELQSSDKGILLYVRDNGIGIAPQRLRQARKENHLGLFGMEERVKILGGTIQFRTEPPAWTTVIAITLPLETT